MQAEEALGFYLDELQVLASQLSLAQLLVPATEALLALAAASPDTSPHRADEPYRRAIGAIHARLASTHRMLLGHEPRRHPVGGSSPYADAAALAADLDIVRDSLVANGSAALARGRLRQLRRAVSVFGFHLAPIDLRQNSDVHQRVVGELLETARPGANYPALDEEARIALLLDELATTRPLASPYVRDRKSTRLNSSHIQKSRMPSSA